MRQNLTCVTLGVKNFKKSVAFYRALGWKGKTMDDVAFFLMNGVVLSLFPRASLAKDAQVAAKGSGFAGFTLAINTKSEKEVNVIILAAEKAGAKIKKRPQKVFWGGYSAFFADPDGFLWEVAHNPFWKLDARGRIAKV